MKNEIQKLFLKGADAFTTHPKQAGETYLEHLWFTLSMAGRFAYISLAILIHGFFPFLFTTTASSQMEKLYRIMKSRTQVSPAFKAMRETYVGDFI